MAVDSSDVIRVVVGVIVSAAMLGVLVPILNTMVGTAEAQGALYEYKDIIGIIPMVLVIVILIMAIGPIVKRKF